MVNKRADTGIYDLWDAPNKQERTHDLTIWYCKKQIVVIYSCICPVTENEFRQNIAKGVWGSTARVLWRNSWLITGQTHEENVNLLSANRTLILFFFFFSSRFRRLCHRIVNLRHFDNFMLVIIMLSSVTIAIEDPVNDNSKRNQVNQTPEASMRWKNSLLLLLTNGLSQYSIEVHGS